MDVKLVALFLILVTIQGFVRGQEPKCFSTFDYQEKLLEKMVTLTHSVHTMEKQLEKKFEELGKASDKVTEDQQALDAKFAKLEGSLKDETKQSFDKMKEKQGKALDDNSKKIDEMLKDTDAKVVRMSKDFYSTNASLTQMIKDSIPPNVAFLAKDVSNLSPGRNAQLVYTTALLNPDNSYSTSSGVFIAPVGGKSQTVYSNLLTLAVILLVIENLMLVMLTAVSSRENKDIHEWCFIMFVTMSWVYMLMTIYIISWANAAVSSRSNHQDSKSLLYKKVLATLNISGFCFAVYLYFRHNWYCEPMVYSMFAVFEYLTIFTNIGFHGTAVIDMRDYSAGLVLTDLIQKQR